MHTNVLHKNINSECKACLLRISVKYLMLDIKKYVSSTFIKYLFKRHLILSLFHSNVIFITCILLILHYITYLCQSICNKSNICAIKAVYVQSICKKCNMCAIFSPSLCMS